MQRDDETIYFLIYYFRASCKYHFLSFPNYFSPKKSTSFFYLDEKHTNLS